MSSLFAKVTVYGFPEYKRLLVIILICDKVEYLDAMLAGEFIVDLNG